MAKRGKKAAGRGKKVAARPGGQDPRKPEWSIVTYAELEEWRAAHEIPKKRLAHLIGVTNSTWHNWARGKATATLATQRRIRAILDGRDADVLRAAQEAPARRVGREARAGLGHVARNGGGRSEVAVAAASIVNAYQQASKGKLSTDEVLAFLREVLRTIS